MLYRASNHKSIQLQTKQVPIGSVLGLPAKGRENVKNEIGFQMFLVKAFCYGKW